MTSLIGLSDLYLLHAPYGGKTNRLGAWKALVEAVEAGKVRSIGVSNYGVHHLEELEEYIKEVDAKEGKGKGGVLSINQVELHPWCQRPDIVNWCQSRGIVMQVSYLVLDKQMRRLTRVQGILPSCQGKADGGTCCQDFGEEARQEGGTDHSALGLAEGELELIHT